MSNEPPFHVISNRDVWNKLIELESAVKSVASDVKVLTERQTENASKIRALELKVYAVAAGVVTAVGILVANTVGGV